jgi:hypothetical protein
MKQRLHDFDHLSTWLYLQNRLHHHVIPEIGSKSSLAVLEHRFQRALRKLRKGLGKAGCLPRRLQHLIHYHNPHRLSHRVPEELQPLPLLLIGASRYLLRLASARRSQVRRSPRANLPKHLDYLSPVVLESPLLRPSSRQ